MPMRFANLRLWFWILEVRTVDGRSAIAVALIFCGTLCIMATLGLAAFLMHLAFSSATNRGGNINFLAPDWLASVIFLALFAGIGMVLVAVIVGFRRPKSG
jgi:hypothetical protein